MTALVDKIRDGCAWVARRARHVHVDEDAIAAYAAALPAATSAGDELPASAAYVLTLDAINFGSGWFPTLRKRPGCSGYHTIAAGLRERFDKEGAWSGAELRALTADQIAETLGQDPDHELMALFAHSLNDLGTRLGGLTVGTSATALVEELATWACFADRSPYAGRTIPFFKRAQIAAADLHHAGAARFEDLHRLTLFADNLVPHVLRLDGVLRFAPALVDRIEAGELIAHDSPEEVEMRAAAVHAAELICDERPDLSPQQVDHILWTRGGGARYKAIPRPRARCTAY
jgi:hypothetical protein